MDGKRASVLRREAEREGDDVEQVRNGGVGEIGEDLVGGDVLERAGLERVPRPVEEILTEFEHQSQHAPGRLVKRRRGRVRDPLGLLLVPGLLRQTAEQVLREQGEEEALLLVADGGLCGFLLGKTIEERASLLNLEMI